MYVRQWTTGCLSCLVTTTVVIVFADVIGRRAERPGQVVTLSVEEERPAGTVVSDDLVREAGLTAEYPSDILSGLEFVLLDSGAGVHGLFQVDRKTGCLQTAVVIDREQFCRQQRVCILRVDIAVQPIKYFEIIKVEITVIDINDNNPSFSPPRLTLSVSESTTVPKELFAVMPATDADSPSHGVAGYQLMSRPEDILLFGLIVNGSSLVTATVVTQQQHQQHPVSATAWSTTTAVDLRLTVLRPLDYETTEIHHLQLIAYDKQSGDSRSLTGTLYIDLLVTDSNDNAPLFDNTSYAAFVWETATSQSTVTTVHATDLDSGSNGRIKYKFSKRTLAANGNMFTLDEDTGVIRLAVHGHQLSQTDYVLAVIAEDLGDIPLSSMVSVVINVVDVNQHAPAIKFDTVNVFKSVTDVKEVQVVERGRSNSTIAMVTVTDADRGDNGRVQCQLKSDGNGQFNIIWLYDTLYRIINTRPLDTKVQDFYELLVECRDEGHVTSLVTTRNLTVQVQPSGSDIPVFSESVYLATLTEHSPLKTAILRVSAADGNTQRASPVMYSLDDDVIHLLSIDEFNGLVTVHSVIDREQVGSQLDFHVFAVLRTRDVSNDVESCALVRLSIIDIDDNTPRFTHSSYSFFIVENATIGSYIGQVHAVDLDVTPTFSQFRYELNSSLFAIDPATGTIVIARTLDRELAARHDVLVTVRSIGMTTYSDVTHVIIDVMDVNDNSPVFIFPTTVNNTVRVRHNLPIGSEVARLVAIDADSDSNANLTYCSYTDEHKPSDILFRVLPSSGLVIVEGNLSTLRNSVSRNVYVLHVCVFDSGVPQRTANSAVFLHIMEPAEYLSTGYDVTNITESAYGHVHIVGVIASAVCIVVIATCSLIAMLVNRRATLRTHTNVANKTPLNRNVAWRKVASSEVAESPLYSVTTSRRHPNTPDHQCDTTDIILTLDSEPVNYATRQRQLISTTDETNNYCQLAKPSEQRCNIAQPLPVRQEGTNGVPPNTPAVLSSVINDDQNDVLHKFNGAALSNGHVVTTDKAPNRNSPQSVSTNCNPCYSSRNNGNATMGYSIDRTKRVHFAKHN